MAFESLSLQMQVCLVHGLPISGLLVLLARACAVFGNVHNHIAVEPGQEGFPQNTCHLRLCLL